MSLIYGYSDEENGNGNGNGDVSDLEKLVGEKTDDRTKDTAFGKIQNNKENIQTKSILLGSKADAKTDSSAFGRIKKNKKDIQSSNSFVGSSSSVEGESTLKGTQLSHASAITAHANDLLEIESNLGLKTNASTADSAFGKIKKNKENIQTSNALVGSSSSLEGEPTLKGTQLSHASAITAHAHNLLNLEDAAGLKTDDKTADSAFGRIQKNKENIEKLKHAVELKETTGTFVAPLDDGKVEITGWTMTRYSTIIAITIKAKQSLLGVSRATLYSGTSSVNNNHTMTVPMSLADMKLGKPAVITHTKDPGHARMYANTRGNAIGSVGDRTVEVKFIYIDHTTPNLNLKNREQ